MRQDPDKILIGEVRDLETAEIAIRAALTGHLVLSTLHTNDAASTVSRLIDMGIDPFMVAQSAVLVSAQRLVRKLCSECKEETKPGKDEFLRWGFTESEAGSKPTIYKAKGCGRCVKGYKGRTALLETLPVTDEIRRIITDGGGALAVKKQSLEDGMLTLRRVGLLNVLYGMTSVNEVLGVSMRVE